MKSKYFIYLIALLLVKAIFMIAIIQYGEIGLGPDEAQYWTWSQQLDWGYYSKPPGIAWQIALTTKLLGNNELGVRFGAIVLSFFISISVYFFALAARLSPYAALWAASIMAFSPIGFISSLFAITDVGMVLFWILASIVFTRALANQQTPNYIILGLLIMAGALFKWPIYLLWVIILCFLPFYPFLRAKHFILGLLISTLGLLPSVIWNSQNNWVTFRHVGATIVGGNESASTGVQCNFFEFIGSQAVLLSPIFFILFLLASVRFFRQDRTKNGPLAFCVASSFGPLLVLILASIFKKMQGNWGSFYFPAASVCAAWYAIEKMVHGRIWLILGICLSLLISSVGLLSPVLQSQNLLNCCQIPYRISPFKHTVGWKNLEKMLIEAGYDPSNDFLFGDKYQMSSILSFYGPEQKRAYFLNLHGVRLNQFSFWPSMAAEQTGKTGYFVVTENMPHLHNLEEMVPFYESQLSKYAEQVNFLGKRSLFTAYGREVKSALIFQCIRYNGQEPDWKHATSF